MNAYQRARLESRNNQNSVLFGAGSFGNITPLASVLSTYMRPFTISAAQRSACVRRVGRRDQGLERATTHRSSDRWLTQLVTMYFRAVSDVHIGGPSSNQATSLESQMIHPTNYFPGGTKE